MDRRVNEISTHWFMKPISVTNPFSKSIIEVQHNLMKPSPIEVQHNLTKPSLNNRKKL